MRTPLHALPMFLVPAALCACGPAEDPVPAREIHQKLYVLNSEADDLTVIDVDTLKAEKSIPVGRLPWGVAIMPGKPGA